MSGEAGEPASAAAPLGPAGPACALHPEAASLFACERCGRFTCEACQGSEAARLCSDCAPRVLDPLGLEQLPFEPRPLVGSALRLAGSELPRLTQVALLFAVVDVVTETWWEHPAGIFLAVMGGLVDVVGTQAMLALLVARTEGHVLTAPQALSQGLASWGATIWASVGKTVLILVYGAVLLAPGVYKAVTLAFASTAALRTTEDPLRYSQRLVEGRWWRVAGLVGAAGVVQVATVLLRTSTVALTLRADPDLALAVTGHLTRLVLSLGARLAVDGGLAALILVGFHVLHREAGLPLPPMAWRRGLTPRPVGAPSL